MIKCKYCEKECFDCRALKIHIGFHKDVSELDKEKYYLSERFGLEEEQFELIKNDYINKICLGVNELNKKYKAELKKFLLLSDIKIRTIKEINTDDIAKKRMEEHWISKYGVNNPSKVEEVKKKKLETHMSNYGTASNFCDKEVWKKAQNNIDRDKRWQSVKKNWMDTYGVDNISKVPEIAKKISTSHKLLCSKKTDEDLRKQTEKARSCIKIESKIQLRVQYIINQMGIEYKSNVFLYSYNFDFMFRGKKILEIQGDFWHGNPNKYKENDILMEGWIVKDVWNKDKRKKELVEKNGYDIYYLWENEINKMTDEDIKDFLIKNIL